ncbi:MAG TPA: LysE family transporter [Candidatus Hydrogenedentes bacterium]|jgi:threonine/homoserine/homoserine lactone efflux protein|nr:MAG: Leucine efflux protein [Candidatus Hydrogenedentes bacterium ADurb.Bin101]HOC70974.1 LysE family transporter [Candidatus Hydrogenedentota bacterium]HQM99795.1 LysE family transporter [Candidatus Hydrogenedentota bacterium]
MPLFFLKGLLVGLSISAPVGPMGLLCIRRTLAFGRLSGILTGLGVATADGTFSTLAAFGVAVISQVLTEHGLLFRLFGAVVLLLLGARIFFSAVQAALPDEKTPARRNLTLYLTALMLGLSNPLAILFFSAVFTGSGLADTGGSLLAGCMLVAGVVSGSLLWWVALSTAVSLLGRKLAPRTLSCINRASGLLIALFGVLMLFR